MPDKPLAYTGSEPYIFISYAHATAERVYPIIEGLQRRGMRVWYDEGLHAGAEWSKEIPHYVSQCGCMICFLSKAFLKSENCADEIFFAREKNKGPLIVYLEDMKLPEDMEFRYGRLHALKLSPNDDLEAFLDKLAVAEILRPCCADPSKLPKIKQPKPAGKQTAYVASNAAYTPKRSGVGRKGIGIGIAVIAVIAAVVLAMTLLPGGGGGVFEDPADQYAQAMSLISQGSYYDAYVILEKLGSYEDSSSQLAAIKDQAMLQKLGTAKKGDTVYWGSYEQDDDESNGKEAISWRVLQVSGGKLLLLSEKGLDCQPYHGKQTAVTWEDSDLRNWLIDDFYNEAFTAKEQEAIAKQQIVTEGSDDTYDPVFMLDNSEAQYYKASLPDFTVTAYATRQGAKDRWWFRGPWNAYGNLNMDWGLTASNYRNDELTAFTTKVSETNHAIRPCIWLDTRTAEEQERDYNDAVALFQSKQYKKALEAFQKLGDYRDCIEYCGRIPKLTLMETFAEAEKGDTVAFGTTDWIVLDKQADKVLVLSKYSLEGKSFHDYSMATPGWENCTLRQWLNGEYLNNNFEALERELILSETVSNSANPDSGTVVGSDTTDRLFLLSYEEVMRYMPQNNDRLLTKKDSTINISWWLRTAGNTTGKACYVDKNGAINTTGDHVFLLNSQHHVRAAMWIDIAE